MEPTIPSVDYNAEFAQGGVKAAIAATGAKESSMLMVPIEKLVVPAGFNVRIHDDDYEARIEEICASIMENGFKRDKPLSGYVAQEGTGDAKQSFIYVTAGFTRLAAVKLAVERGTPIEAVPVVLKPAGTSMLDLTLDIQTDNTGAPLKPYEKGILVKRAISYGADVPKIARKWTVTEQYVNDLLYLHSLPTGTQQMVIVGQISAGHAMKMSRHHGPAEALKIMQAALAAGTPTEDAGDGETAAAPSTPAPRLTPARTRAAAGAGASGKMGVKEQLAVAMAAINYCITLPGDGIEFLTRWRDEDAEARAEVMATLAPAAKPPTKKAQAEAARKAKAEAKEKAAKEKADKKAAREKAAKERADKKAERERKAAAAAATAPKSADDIGL